LYEEFLYDESGQPLATSFMDYLLPTSLDVPDVDFFMTEDAPTPNNPFGAKGLGEVGLIAVGAAVAGAIDDAFGEAMRSARGCALPRCRSRPRRCGRGRIRCPPTNRSRCD